MKRIATVFAFLFVFTSISPLLYSNPFAQENMQKNSDKTKQLEQKKKSVVHALTAIVESIKELKTEINNLRTESKDANTPDKKLSANAIEKEKIPKIKKKIADLEKDFESIAAGGEFSSLSDKTAEDFAWKDEVLELVTPLIREIKHMTARPRQIEKLRRETAFYLEQIKDENKALESIRHLIDQEEMIKDLKAKLIDRIKIWESRKKHSEQELTVVKYQLNALENERGSLIDSTQNFLKSFFKERGRNIVLAFVVFCSVFALLRLIHRLIYRYSPFHNAENRSFFIRLSDIVYHFFSFLGAISALLFVLYVSGDWLLLSIAIIFIIGLAWTAKEGLPKFWQDIQLILNLGTVRENELVIYKEIPWRVVSINFFAFLENPELKTKKLKLPLKTLIGMNSRPFHKNYPWFPSRIGDWVILSDGTRGEVITQTPEVVQLRMRGGSLKTYLTRDFLGLSPLNISADFRLKVVFGFDYEHQAVFTNEIPSKLTEALKQGLSDSGYGEDIIQLKVEVETAGASSLDLVIIADFHGRIAALYNKIKRELQKITIETCSANEWGIPFPQVTVHMADSLKP